MVLIREVNKFEKQDLVQWRKQVVCSKKE